MGCMGLFKEPIGQWHFASSQVGVIRISKWIYIYVDDEAIMDQFQSRLGYLIQLYILSDTVY